MYNIPGQSNLTATRNCSGSPKFTAIVGMKLLCCHLVDVAEWHKYSDPLLLGIMANFWGPF